MIWIRPWSARALLWESPKSDLAREALKRYLRVAEFRTLRTKLVARAQAGGINTDEDVFEVLKKK